MGVCSSGCASAPVEASKSTGAHSKRRHSSRRRSRSRFRGSSSGDGSSASQRASFGDNGSFHGGPLDEYDDPLGSIGSHPMRPPAAVPTPNPTSAHTHTHSNADNVDGADGGASVNPLHSRSGRRSRRLSAAAVGESAAVVADAEDPEATSGAANRIRGRRRRRSSAVAAAAIATAAATATAAGGGDGSDGGASLRHAGSGVAGRGRRFSTASGSGELRERSAVRRGSRVVIAPPSCSAAGSVSGTWERRRSSHDNRQPGPGGAGRPHDQGTARWDSEAKGAGRVAATEIASPLESLPSSALTFTPDPAQLAGATMGYSSSKDKRPITTTGSRSIGGSSVGGGSGDSGEGGGADLPSFPDDLSDDSRKRRLSFYDESGEITRRFSLRGNASSGGAGGSAGTLPSMITLKSAPSPVATSPTLALAPLNSLVHVTSVGSLDAGSRTDSAASGGERSSHTSLLCNGSFTTHHSSQTPTAFSPSASASGSGGGSGGGSAPHQPAKTAIPLLGSSATRAAAALMPRGPEHPPTRGADAGNPPPQMPLPQQKQRGHESHAAQCEFRPDHFDCVHFSVTMQRASHETLAEWRALYFADPYITRIRFKHLDAWLDEIGTVPPPVTSMVSHTLDAEGGRLTAKRLQLNHRLLLQIQHRTKGGARLPSANPLASPRTLHPNSYNSLTSPSQLQQQQQQQRRQSLSDSHTASFDEDALRRASRISQVSQNRVPARGGDEDEEGSGPIDFLCELEEEERRDSMIQSDSSSFDDVISEGG